MMKLYYYEVLDERGNKLKGFFKGSFDEFEKFLKNRGYFILKYEERNDVLKKGRFDIKDYLSFIEELKYMLSSGLSLDLALKKLIESSNKDSQKKFIENVYSFLKEGNMLSDAINKSLKKEGLKVDSLSVLLIKINESVGNLSLGLQKAYEHLIFKEKIKSEIKQALSYPLFLIGMSIFLVFFVFVFIVPKFAQIFSPQEFEKLPYLSKMILKVGLFVNSYLSSIFFSLIIGSIIIFLTRKEIMQILLKISLFIPYFKNIIYNLQLSYFFGSLSLMLEGGIDIKKAFSQSKEIVTIDELKYLIEKIENDINHGIKISESLVGNSLIDSNIISLIAAGENSNNLSQVFKSISQRYLEYFQKRIKSFLSLLEPIIIITVGALIAVIVIAIMSAVMSVSDVVG